MSMSKKIFAVVALLMAVAVIITAVSIYCLVDLDKNTKAMSEQAERGLQLIIMDRATRKRAAATLRTIVNTDSAIIDKIVKEEYEPTSAEFAEAVNTYRANVPENSPDEMKGRMGIIQPLWDAYTKATDKAVELARQNTITQATAKILESDEFFDKLEQDIMAITSSIKDDDPPEVLRHRLGLARARADTFAYRYYTVQYANAETADLKKSHSEDMKKYLDDCLVRLRDAMKAPGDVGRKAGELAASLADKGVAYMNDVITLGARDSNLEAIMQYRENVDPALKALDAGTEGYITAANQNRAETRAYVDRLSGEATLATVLVAAIGIVLSGILAFVIVSSITRQLTRIIDELGEASTQVAGASGMISASSSKLAEGATQQAASLEETSASLEEMASMTRKNADNANLTSTSTTHTVKLIDEGTKAVNNMSTAMTEISDSAGKISLIIKTIEEISFQTNLLALNAAVEAARAGEAGKGFAVVADEVRNLAQRAAQAARDTSELIEGTVTRVKNGSEVAAQLETGFKEIDSGAKQVGNLITEITTATSEQAQGVDQINTAVGQMDKVTQANAANSEECASAAEELSAQAEALHSMVDDLVVLVTGGRGGTARAAGRAASPKPAGKTVKAAPPAKRPAAAPKHLAAPDKNEDAIPMGGDDDFKDF